MQNKTLWLALRAPVSSPLDDHLKASPRIIFAVHPGDGEEVRQLPEEKDGKETPGAGIQPPAGGRPADHRRQRSWNGAHQGVGRADSFQRRVGKNVDDDRRGRERGA